MSYYTSSSLSSSTVKSVLFYLTAVAKNRVISDPLYLEVLHHATMAEKRTEAFVGRAHLLRKVQLLLNYYPLLIGPEELELIRTDVCILLNQPIL